MTSTSKPRRLSEVLRLRPEVGTGDFDPAVSLSKVLGREGWEADPVGFLERTHISYNMKRALLTVLATISAKPVLRAGNVEEHGAHVLVLPSMLGGGKTHLLAFIYHALRLLAEKKQDVMEHYDTGLAEALSRVSESLSGREIRVTVVVGDSDKYAPKPGMPVMVNGWKISTLWGYILASLGLMNSELYRSIEEKGVVPGKDTLQELLGDPPNVILIDEISTYLSSLPSPEMRDSVVAFLKNLFEAADNCARTIVVITLPGEIRGREEIRVEHSVTGGSGELVNLVYKMANRVTHKVLPPLKVEVDIVPVLRKRLLENTVEELNRLGQEIASFLLVRAEEEYREATNDAFKGFQAFLEKIIESYPFHPSYIEVLLKIGSYIEIMGRTRSLLELTRIVLSDSRTLESSLVMPWHIDVEDDAIRSRLLASHYMRDLYTKALLDDLKIVREGLLDRPKELRLAEHIIKTVWLYSIALSTQTFTRMIDESPSVKGITAIVLDPLELAGEIRSADVPTVLSDLLERFSLYMQEYRKKLMYPPTRDVTIIIRRNFNSLASDIALEHIEKALNEVVKQRGEKIRKTWYILDKVKLSDIRNEILRSEDPALTIIATPSSLLESEISELLPRNNTFAIEMLYRKPILDPKRDPTLVMLSRYKLNEQIETLGELAVTLGRLLEAINITAIEIKNYYASEEERELREVLEKQLKKELEKVRDNLHNTIMKMLTRMHAGRDGKDKFEVEKFGPLGGERETLANFIKRVEYYLVRTRGYPAELTEDLLLTAAFLMGRVRYEETLDAEIIYKPIKLGDLWSFILTSSDEKVKPHLLSWEDIERGIEKLHTHRDSFERLAIIIEGSDENVILWKKVYPLEESEGKSEFDDSYSLDEIRSIASRLLGGSKPLRLAMIVHPITVVKELVDKLLKEEEQIIKRDGIEYRRTYYVKKAFEPELTPLSQIMDMFRVDEIGLFRRLADAILVYQDIPVEKKYTPELIEPERGKEIILDKGKPIPVIIRIQSYDYPARIVAIYEIVHRDSDTRIVGPAEVEVKPEGTREFNVEKVINIPIPEEPGTYQVNIFTKGEHVGDRKIHIGSITVKVTGYSCLDLSVELARKEDLKNVLNHYEKAEAYRIRISLPPDASLAAISTLLNLLAGIMKLIKKAFLTADLELTGVTGLQSVRISLNETPLDKSTGSLIIDAFDMLRAGWNLSRANLSIKFEPVDLVQIQNVITGIVRDEQLLLLVNPVLDVRACKEVK